MRTLRAVLGLLAPAALLSAAACDAPGGRERSGPPGASPPARPDARRLVVRERIPAFLAPNGDSLLLSPASASAISGRRVAAVLTYDDRVAVHDIEAGTAVLLGGPGRGPGELTGGMWQVALSPAGFTAAASVIDGRVHVWAPDGALHFSRAVTPQLDMYPTVAVDDSGRAYVAAESHASGRRRVQLIRLGRDAEDSAGSAWLEVPQPIVRVGARGSVRRTLPNFAYLYGDNPGKLWWAVDASGLIYLANADRYQVDTMRLGGGGRGPLVARPEVEPEAASDAELERIVGSRAAPGPGEAAVTQRDLGRVRRAVVHGLMVEGDELWVGRRRGADTASEYSYDLYGPRDGRFRRAVPAPRQLIGIGRDAALSATVDDDGERSLLLFRWVAGDTAAAAGDGVEPRVLTPRAGIPRPAVARIQAPASPPRVSIDTSGRYPGVGCSVIHRRAASDTTLVRVRIEAGPPNERRRVLARAVPASAGGAGPSVSISLVGEDASSTCSGRAVEFVLKGVLRLDLRVTATATGPLALTIYDANDSRRSVTRVVRLGEGEVAVELPPR